MLKCMMFILLVPEFLYNKIAIEMSTKQFFFGKLITIVRYFIDPIVSHWNSAFPKAAIDIVNCRQRGLGRNYWGCYQCVMAASPRVERLLLGCPDLRPAAIALEVAFDGEVGGGSPGGQPRSL